VQAFLNSCPRSVEYVSLYIDNKLRKGLGTASDLQAEETLDQVLQIFRCARVTTCAMPLDKSFFSVCSGSLFVQQQAWLLCALFNETFSWQSVLMHLDS
jgi:hypothetical protein